jgi:SAM-dependent methyltransferase
MDEAKMIEKRSSGCLGKFLKVDAPFDLQSVFEADDYLYFYEDSLTEERSEREVSNLIRLLELQPPMKILDLACGFGRHANRLAAQGFSVTGVDIIPEFLKIAENDARSRNVHVNYLQADMRQFHFLDEFDRVMILFSAFGYFDDGDNQRVLENAGRALKPGGMLGFDIPNRDATLKTLPPATVVEKNDDLMINRNAFDMRTGRWHNRRVIIRDGVRKDKPFSMRLYNLTEIESMITHAGLAIRHIFSDWNAQPLSPDARGAVIVAKKEGSLSL